MVFNVFAWISIVLAACYAALMLLYRFGWSRLPETRLPKGYQPATTISVIVPARNEAAHIGNCLQSILANHYPDTLLEIIVVDDHSEDHSADIVLHLAARNRNRIRLLRLAELIKPGESVHAYKKKALELAVAHARGALIVTTDADCTVTPDWLWLIAHCFEQQQPVAITGPVLIGQERNVLQFFQSLDTAGMMLITGAGIRLGFQHMGNGANLAYTKKAFEAVQGYTGNRHRASGDDMFLLHKLALQFPGRIRFLKNPEAAVQTEAPAGLTGFLRQRLRWGSKTTALPEWQTKAVLAVVFGFSCCIVFSIPLAFGLHHFRAAGLTIGLLLTKAASDYFLLSDACRYFRRTDLMGHFRWSFVLHTFYICLVGTAGLFIRDYQWKGRRVR